MWYQAAKNSKRRDAQSEANDNQQEQRSYEQPAFGGL